ncbi:transposase domain-containing protein [Micromonospora sp. LOL_023]|uniref:transposase domain-containing protein n=1 Tax=Micromonospora sp. LOL_023 TaxID=3345418 RepID=UPI003A8C1A9C
MAPAGRGGSGLCTETERGWHGGIPFGRRRADHRTRSDLPRNPDATPRRQSRCIDTPAVHAPAPRKLGSWDDWQVPTKSATSRARQRLGPEPMKVLFEQAAVPWPRRVRKSPGSPAGLGAESVGVPRNCTLQRSAVPAVPAVAGRPGPLGSGQGRLGIRRPFDAGAGLRHPLRPRQ